jgi:hypothetical protein
MHYLLLQLTGMLAGLAFGGAVDVIFVPYAKRAAIRKVFNILKVLEVISGACFAIFVATCAFGLISGVGSIKDSIDSQYWFWYLPTLMASLVAGAIVIVVGARVSRYLVNLYRMPGDKSLSPWAYKKARRAYRTKQPIYDPRQDDGARMRAEEEQANSTDTFEGAWKALQQSPHTIEDERALKERFAHGGTVSTSGIANTTNTASAANATSTASAVNTASTINVTSTSSTQTAPLAPKTPPTPKAPPVPKSPASPPPAPKASPSYAEHPL